ncbi:alkaline phosphatase family protein [Nocardiopsis composta]
MPQQTVTVNGRDYRTPQAPVVVVCIDGSEPDYHEKAIAAGRMPFLAGLRAKGGAFLDAECAMPSFTNPNNLSIATGVPPAVHGICGNYFYDPDSGEEVMMNDPGLLRAPPCSPPSPRPAARSRWSPPRTSCAACSAGACAAAACASPRRRPTPPPSPTTASRTSWTWSAWTCPRCTAPG